jgi:hypothetical protein
VSSHRLREALVSDPRLEGLYRGSPEFRAGVEQLVRMLPQWVQLMADDADRLEQQRILMTETLVSPRFGWTPQFPIPQRD